MRNRIDIEGGQLLVAAFTAAATGGRPARDHYELLEDVEQDVLAAAFFASIGSLVAAVEGLARLRGLDPKATTLDFAQHIGLIAAGGETRG